MKTIAIILFSASLANAGLTNSIYRINFGTGPTNADGDSRYIAFKKVDSNDVIIATQVDVNSARLDAVATNYATNYVFTVTNLPTGSSVVVSNTATTGGVAYFSIGIPITPVWQSNSWANTCAVITNSANFAFGVGSSNGVPVKWYWSNSVVVSSPWLP